MAFTILENGVTISATVLNDNFYWIGQGDLLPMGGTTLTPETGQHNLGSSANKWRSVYVNEIAGTVTVSGPSTFNGTVTFNTTTSLSSGFLGYYPVLIAHEQQPTSTAASTCTTSYTARVLNTTTSITISGASVTSNQISLPAGTYEVNAISYFATTGTSNYGKTRLYNVTAGTTTAFGISWFSFGGSVSPFVSELLCVVTCAAQTVFELQDRSSVAVSRGGASTTRRNTYSTVQIVRIA